MKVGKFECMLTKKRVCPAPKGFFPSKSALCKFIMKEITLERTASIKFDINGVEIIEYIF